MVRYKTVAGPVGLTISQYDSYDNAVRQYAHIINREAVDGWRLHCIQEIPVTRDNGCMGALRGQATTTVTFNMLVFVQEIPEESNRVPQVPTYAEPKQMAPNTMLDKAPGKESNQGNAPVNAQIQNGEKICPQCGMAQRRDRKVCWSCGQKFDN